MKCDLVLHWPLERLQILIFPLSGDVSFRVASETSAYAANRIVIAVDGQDIFHVDDFIMETLCDLEDLRLERHNTDGFQLDWNKTW